MDGHVGGKERTMAQRAGRLSCTRCGANNFDTVTACWKCGAALSANASGVAVMPVGPMMPGERVAPIMIASPSGDSGMAKRAAIALALTLPFIGLPVGWIFMMIEDSRKQAIGRLCANVSMIGLLLHLVLMYFGMQATMALAMKYLPGIAGGLQNSQRGGAPDTSLPRGMEP